MPDCRRFWFSARSGCKKLSIRCIFIRILYYAIGISFLAIFESDSAIGIIGMVGAKHLSHDGVMAHENRIGNLYGLEKWKQSPAGKDSNIALWKEGIGEVEAVEGLLMAIQYDLPWREGIVIGWDFYNISHCLEFRRVGLRIVVPGQRKAWCIHVWEVFGFRNWEETRRAVLKAYPDFFPSTKSFLYCETNMIQS